MNSVTVGCNYRKVKDIHAPYMNMHGRVTDFHMWDRILSQEEMVKITGCQQFGQGNLVNWDKTEFYLNRSKRTARKQEMDLELEVCGSPSPSLALIPYTMIFDPEALHYCSKLSGQVASFSEKYELVKIFRFLSRYVWSCKRI